MPIVLKPSQLPGALRAEARFAREAVRKGAIRAANRGKTLLVERTDQADKVYLGQFIRSFRVIPGSPGSTTLATLDNNSPPAGIIELGARPHPVSAEGIEALTRWVLARVDGIDDEKDARAMAQAIAWKLRHHGQHGTYLFRNAQRDLAGYLSEAVRDMLREHADKRKAGAA